MKNGIQIRSASGELVTIFRGDTILEAVAQYRAAYPEESDRIGYRIEVII